jgi:hypothetical protein
MLKVRLKSLARKQTIGFSTSLFGNRSTSILEYIITPLILLGLGAAYATQDLYFGKHLKNMELGFRTSLRFRACRRGRGRRAVPLWRDEHFEPTRNAAMGTEAHF